MACPRFVQQIRNLSKIEGTGRTTQVFALIVLHRDVADRLKLSEVDASLGEV